MRQEERDGRLKMQNPREILRDLQLGNKRFQSKQSETSPMSLVARHNMIHGQAPKVMVIGCADSRVPTEVIFDQGIGDVFVCRNAAAQVGERVLGTVEFGVFHLGIKLVVVMNHEGCGAIRAARSPPAVIKNEPPRLRTMLMELHLELDRCSAVLDAIADPVERDKQAALVNSHAQVRAILPSLRAKVDSGEVLVLAAFYNITTGEVEFSEVDPSLAVSALPITTMTGEAKAQAKAKAGRVWCLPGSGSLLPGPLHADFDYGGHHPVGSGMRDWQRPPEEILEMLKEGNHRFWTGTPVAQTSQPPAQTAGRRPKCMVLGCADSRVPIEIVFDQSAGDIYVARNAGNLWTTTVAASVELAIYHLGVQLVVVLGHQACGAVKASRMTLAQIEAQSPKLRDMLLDMRESISYCFETLDKIQDANSREREAVIANAQQQVRKILREPAVRAKVDAGKVLVVAGFYEIVSGIVDFVPLPKEAFPVRNTGTLLPWGGATALGPRMVMNEPPQDCISKMSGTSKIVGGIGARRVTHQDLNLSGPVWS